MDCAGIKVNMKSTTVNWLGLLSLQAVVILVIQLILAFMTGSLELSADAVHSAVDVVTYSFNWGVEWMKLYALSSTLHFLNYKMIDEIGSIVSVVALLWATALITNEALYDLSDEEAKILESQALVNDPRGMALLIFGFIGFSANAWVLYLYRAWGLNLSTSSDEQQPLAAAPASSCGEHHDCEHGGHGHGHAHTHGHGHGHGHGQAQAKEEEPTAMQWLHKLVHPGCEAGGCSHKADAVAEQNDMMVNLNLSAAFLHLVSDVMRAITVAISGVLIQCHYTSAWKIDAVGSLCIAGFNVLGCGTLLVKCCKGH